jgi:hypothetical protein
LGQIQPDGEIRANKTKAKPNETKQKSCVSLFFFGRIWTFQRVTGEKIKKLKNFRLAQLALRVVWALSVLLRGPISPRRRTRAGGSAQRLGDVAQILGFEKPLQILFSGKGEFRMSVRSDASQHRSWVKSGAGSDRQRAPGSADL